MIRFAQNTVISFSGISLRFEINRILCLESCMLIRKATAREMLPLRSMGLDANMQPLYEEDSWWLLEKEL